MRIGQTREQLMEEKIKLLAKVLSERRPDLSLQGLDVLPRAESHIPVRMFDGEHIPYPDKSFDVVLFVDVLHHTSDALALLPPPVRGRVTFLAWMPREQLMKVYDRHGIFLFPSRFEGFAPSLYCLCLDPRHVEGHRSR